MLPPKVLPPKAAPVTIDWNGNAGSAPASYKKDWANELHPSGDGFSGVSNKFAVALDKLP